ncbi:hypothetical protein IWX49DRAFT_558234 [Phyllosticta citricarpa]|uniref:Uncharacterized protein n=1 Tax=Phyllosticta citricarpa TaxID=55181 RepID=A0ABR1L2C9_9PEZI
MADSRNVCLLLLVEQQRKPFVGGSSGLGGRKSLDERRAAYEPLAKNTLEEHKVPGASVVVVQGEKTFAEPPTTYFFLFALCYIGSMWIQILHRSITATPLRNHSQHHLPNPPPHAPMSSLIPSHFVLPDAYATQHATIADLLAHRKVDRKCGMRHHGRLGDQ